jgi:hypothetical protein
VAAGALGVGAWRWRLVGHGLTGGGLAGWAAGKGRELRVRELGLAGSLIWASFFCFMGQKHNM